MRRLEDVLRKVSKGLDGTQLATGLTGVASSKALWVEESH